MILCSLSHLCIAVDKCILALEKPAYIISAFIMPLLLFAKENVGYLSLPTQKENTKLLQLTKP